MEIAFRITGKNRNYHAALFYDSEMLREKYHSERKTPIQWITAVREAIFNTKYDITESESCWLVSIKAGNNARLFEHKFAIKEDANLFIKSLKKHFVNSNHYYLNGRKTEIPIRTGL